MSNERPHELLGNLAPLLAIVLLATGAFVFNAALKSSRPADVDLVRPTIGELQDVPARLWQDPFAAVEDAIKSGALAKRPHGPDELWGSLDNRPEQRYVQVLVVTLPASAYAEDAETRRRTRYAVIAGLTAMRYVPLNPDSIGYVSLPEDIIAATGERSTIGSFLPTRVPYEVYRPQGWERERPWLLLLWLEDPGWAGGQYVHRIAGVMRSLCGTMHGDLCGVPAMREMRIIGPGSSGALHSLIFSLASPPDMGDFTMQFYSPFATAPQTAVYNSMWSALEERLDVPAYRDAPPVRTDTPVLGCVLPDRFGADKLLQSKCPVRVVRTVGGDDDLAALMTRELAMRGVNGPAWSCNDPVVFVSERDTTYGRELAEQFKTELAAAPACAGEGGGWQRFFKGRRLAPDDLVWEVGYFRGLDGRAVGEAPERDQAQQSPQRRGLDALQLGTAQLERGEGRSQFDYVRRLASAIATREASADIPVTLADLYRFEGRQKIKAIGVLGNDVYDKLLVLQAMHGGYPYAMFFTTDLDARLLQKDQNQWSRNLIVASHYGLALRRELQGATPPFRSGYQTATYLAALLALQPRDAGIDSDTLERWNRPRTYEIGRTRAMALNPAQRQAVIEDHGPCALDSIANCGSLHPRLQPTEQPMAAAILAVLAGGGLLLLSSVALRGQVSRRPWRTLRRLALAGLAVALVLSEAVRVLFARASEPFTWVEGVSLWPSIFLLVAAAVLAVYSRFWIDRAYRSALAVIGAEFFDDSVATRYRRRMRRRIEQAMRRNRTTHERRGWRRRMQSSLARFRRRLADYQRWGVATNSGKPLHGSFAWEAYVHRSETAPSRARIWPLAILCFLFGYFLFLLGPQILPFRGEATWAVAAFVYVVSGLALLWLIFQVVDVTRLSTRFICWLACRPTHYPAATLVRQGEELGLDREYVQKAIVHPQGVRVLDSWVDYRFVVRLTSEVERYIYFPFIVLAIFILAQTRLFDDWQPSPAVVTAIIVALGYAIWCARSLRKGAEDARAHVLQEYDRLLVRSTTDTDAAKEIPPGFIKMLVDRIKVSQEGAFRPFLQRPIVRAVLIPFGSLGGISLVELLLTYLG